jgi:hypothetical protein
VRRLHDRANRHRLWNFNLYSGRVCPAGSLELGTFDFAAGQYKLHFASVAKPAGSTGFAFGLDTIDLLPPLEGKPKEL